MRCVGCGQCTSQFCTDSQSSSTMVNTPRAVGVITKAIPLGSAPTQSSSGSAIVSTSL
ncbi:hypothetical protein A2U01_0085346, partial [Trifolium medium]|nr:hypothetical protein [Trifolium medium]